MALQFDERDSLKMIHQMIHHGRRNLKTGSIYYLIWGWAVLLAGMGQYFLLEFFKYQHHWVTWPVLMTLAGIVAAVTGIKQGRRKKYVTFTDTAMKYLWMGFGIHLIAVLAMSIHIGWAASYVLTVGLYGLGTFVSGGILQFRPLIAGGLASMALAFVGVFASGFFSSFSNVLLMLCASIVISYLIPGYLLRAQKNEDAA